MNRILAALVFFVLLLPASADELRIARYDVQRVFDQYQHTKDIQTAIDMKRNVTGPGTDNPMLEYHYNLKKRLDALTEKFKVAASGTPEHDRLELQVQIATLELQISELGLTIKNIERQETQQDELRRQREGILGEILAVAKSLSTERGYRVLVPDNLPAGGPFLTFVVSGATEDLTEPILARLNEQYATKKTK